MKVSFFRFGHQVVPRRRFAALLCMAIFVAGCGEQAAVLTNAGYDLVPSQTMISARIVIYDDSGKVVEQKAFQVDGAPHGAALHSEVSAGTSTPIRVVDQTYFARHIGNTVEFYHIDTMLARVTGSGASRNVDYYSAGQVRLHGTFTANWSAIRSASVIEDENCDPDWYECDEESNDFLQCLDDAAIITLGIAATSVVGYGIVASIGMWSDAVAAEGIAKMTYFEAIGTADQTVRFVAWQSAKTLVLDRRLSVIGWFGGAGGEALFSLVTGAYRAWANAVRDFQMRRCWPISVVNSANVQEKVEISNALDSFWWGEGEEE